MECLPGSALFLGDKRNNHDHNWCCDESDLELSKKHWFANYKERMLQHRRQLWLGRLRRWPVFGEALEPKIIDACWEESDWNECLGEEFFENMYRIHIKGLLAEQEYFLRPFNDEETIGMFTMPPMEKIPLLVRILEKMPWGVPVLLEMPQRVRMLEEKLEKRERCFARRLENQRERKPLVRHARLRIALRKVLHMEKRERLDIERLRSMLRFIRNNRFTATASAQGIHIKITEGHSMYNWAKYWRTDRLYTHGDLRRRFFKALILMEGSRIFTAAANACRPFSIVNIGGVDPWNILLSKNNVSKSRDFHKSWQREGTYSSEASWKNIDVAPKVKCRKTCRSFGSWDLARLDTSCFIQAYLHALDAKCSVTTSVKGGSDKRIGRHTVRAPKYLRNVIVVSVRHPLLQMQMVLFSDKRYEDILFCKKSRVPRSIFNKIAKRLLSFVSPNVCDAGCISAKPNIESINTGIGFELNPKESIGKSNRPTENESPNAKGNDDHRSVYQTELDNQFVHAVDGVHLPFSTAGAVVTHGPVLPETSLVPVSQLFAPDFRMSRLLRHGDRLDILETKEIVRRLCMGHALFPVVPGIYKRTFSQLCAPSLMMSDRHPLIQMALSARKRFEDMFTMARRLCSFALANLYGAEWASAKLKPESLYDGMGSESVLRENICTSNKLTENEGQRHSAENGVKAVVTKITPCSWVVATAAPHHATGNRDLLHGFVTEHDDQFVHAVDGVPMAVHARGAVVTDAVVLPDVWFVPGLKSNMVSVSQLAELGYSVGFGCGECCIRSAGDGKIVGKARLGKDGLYKLDFLKVSLAM